MTTLLLGVTTLAVAVLGWFGYKALLRINTWGQNMNDLDLIFQDSAQETGGWSSRPISKRKAGGVSLVPTPHHLA
jgi:hypothetical protein